MDNLLLVSISNTFEAYKMKKVLIDDVVNFTNGREYYKVSFTPNFAFLEYAQSYDEAILNIYEDVAMYPITLGNDEIARIMRSDIEYCLKKQ